MCQGESYKHVFVRCEMYDAPLRIVQTLVCAMRDVGCATENITTACLQHVGCTMRQGEAYKHLFVSCEM